MKADNSFEHRIGIKISLLFLIVILYVIGIFIYSYSLKRNVDIQQKEISDSYIVLSQRNQLILSMQDAQDALNAYLVNPRRTYLRKYDSISANISHQVSDIKKLTPRRNQDVYLLSVDSLLFEKNKIVRQLVVLFRSQSPLEELDKKIQTYGELIQDSVVVTTNKDTTLVVKDKKGIWTQLKNFVNPNRAPDTIISLTQVEQETRLISRVDTAVYADLKNISEAASKTYSIQLSGIEKRVQELVFAEQNISLQLSQLLTKFYNETTLITHRGIQSSQKLTGEIFTFAVVVGALSLLLILVIILFIIGDLKKGHVARLDLAKEKQLTESLMESRHKLLLSVSHDIKTPLSSMMGYMQMWQNEKISENQKRQLQSAQNSGKHILNMLSNLLEFSRLERNFAEIHISGFDLIELTDEIIRMFNPLIEEKKLDIAFENRVGTSFFIETDYTLLKQILINVISNAVKYTVEGKIDIEVSHDEQLVLSVSDTGIGINESDIPEIFKPFSRIKNPLKAEGSGFGMYVTRGLILSLKGEITVRSKEGVGTRVIIKLPLHPTERKTDENSSDKPVKQDRMYEKILFFEDDRVLGNMLKEFLQRRGFHVQICNDPSKADDFIKDISRFDIAFTDMQMMHITGNDILRKVRETNSTIPVWLISAYDDYSTEKALAEGFAGFINKPVEMSKLDHILSGGKTAKPENAPRYDKQFPYFASLFGNDTEAIRNILTTFVSSARKDTQTLIEHVKNSDFKGAQQLCHRMYPFIEQISGGHLCDVLKKMDSLRGQEETAFPGWKENILLSVQQIREFARKIEMEYLG
ncbi:MAG: response regulator [Porphyromonadaceae bacterium]|nr:response regulator [Porphyromonadaceae bacterium]